MAYVMIARWTARPGEEQAVAEAIGRLVKLSRTEPGNLIYQAHRDPQDPRVFVLYEAYVDESAYAAHAASEHFHAHAVSDGIPRLDNRERQFLVTMDY